MFARTPVAVPETPVSQLGRSIRVGDDVAIEVDGQLVAGAYLRRRVIADATSVRQVVVLRLLGLEREATYDVESITRVEPITNERERERYAHAQSARRRVVSVDGRPTTIQYAAQRLGITPEAVTKRLRHWGDVERAITAPPRKQRKPRRDRRVAGMTVAEAARKTGLTYRTIWHRLESGLPDELVLSPHRRPALKRVAWRDRELDVKALAREVGLAPTTLYNRLGAGWSLQDAIAVPPSRSNSRRGFGAPKEAT